MLQLRALHAAAFQPPPSIEGADAWLTDWRARRLAGARGPAARLAASLDAALRTEIEEHFDRAETSDADRRALARTLDRFNRLHGSYGRFLRLLRPTLDEVSAREGRPARVLELASGSGAFSMALAVHARRAGLAVEVTGSDIQPDYVRAANAASEARGAGVRFIHLDACAIDLDPGRFDLVFIANSLHHFSARQLAAMVAGARRVATTGFVGVDGHRSLYLLAWLAVVGAVLPPWPLFLHDSVVTGRKLYSEPELEAITRLGAPDARVSVRTSWPGYSVVAARWG
ncbi:MAG: class I SAM-dependent methyltransferase [Alphaproteobacteria bacterium]|nr:class I SAM-dependent methyltransferase [Alphaproteobacteria bacterium]